MMWLVHRRRLLLYASAFLMDLGTYSGYIAIPFRVQDRMKAGLRTHGLLALILLATYLLLCPLVGRLAPRGARRRAFIVAGPLVVAGAYILVAAATAVWHVAALTVVMAAGRALFWPSLEAEIGGAASGRALGRRVGTFNIAWSADAIGKLVLKGKDVHPGECLLVLNPQAYITLLKDLAATTATAVAYARPDIIQKGLIEEYLGVRIVVSGNIMRSDMASGIGGGATTYQVNFLMRPKRALALAPKRDILIETDKIIASRTLRIVATHTFGVAAIDLTEVVPIWSGLT